MRSFDSEQMPKRRTNDICEHTHSTQPKSEKKREQREKYRMPATSTVTSACRVPFVPIMAITQLGLALGIFFPIARCHGLQWLSMFHNTSQWLCSADEGIRNAIAGISNECKCIFCIVFYFQFLAFASDLHLNVGQIIMFELKKFCWYRGMFFYFLLFFSPLTRYATGGLMMSSMNYTYLLSCRKV